MLRNTCHVEKRRFINVILLLPKDKQSFRWRLTEGHRQSVQQGARLVCQTRSLLFVRSSFRDIKINNVFYNIDVMKYLSRWKAQIY